MIFARTRLRQRLRGLPLWLRRRRDVRGSGRSGARGQRVHRVRAGKGMRDHARHRHARPRRPPLRRARAWPSRRAPPTACTSRPTCAVRSSRFDDGREIELGNTRVQVLHTPGTRPRASPGRDRSPAGPGAVVRAHRRHAVRRRRRPPGSSRRALGRTLRELHESIHEKLLTLPDDVEVYPAHFAGSACGAGLSGKPSSTIGFEKRLNPLLSLTGMRSWTRCGRATSRPAEIEAVLEFNVDAQPVDQRRRSASPSWASRGTGAQFALLVVVNAFVGAMVGLERSILPALAEQRVPSGRAGRGAVLHRRFRRRQGADQLLRRTAVGPRRTQAGARGRLARSRFPCRSC